jgi:hypothetical protein
LQPPDDGAEIDAPSLPAEKSHRLNASRQYIFDCRSRKSAGVSPSAQSRCFCRFAVAWWIADVYLRQNEIERIHKMKQIIVLIVALAVLTFVGCSSNDSGGQSQSGQTAASNIELGGQPVTLAGIHFTPPTRWKVLGPSGMRKAEYSFGPADDDTDSATVAVYYFGPNQGGGVMDNIERWINQMSMPDGSSPGTKAVQNTLTVDGMKVHTVELNGTYNASMGGPMSGQSEAMPGYHMTAAVLEGPEGNVFFKLTGPQKTAEEMTKGFMAMLQNVKKAPAPAM